jgi:hypothetical protein
VIDKESVMRVCHQCGKLKDNYHTKRSTICDVCRVVNYRKKHPEQHKAAKRRWRKRHAVARKAYNNAWRLRNLVYARACDQAKSLRVKTETFNAYGGCHCVWCGEADIQALCIDHINNDGASHRKALGAKCTGNITGERFYRWLRRNHYPKGFQVLCFNCNQAKSRNGGVLPLSRRNITLDVHTYSLAEYALREAV